MIETPSPLHGEALPLAGRRFGLLTASASRLGGGVFEAVVVHAQMIRDLGGDVEIFALHDAHSDEDRHRYGPSPLHTVPVVGPRQVGLAPGLTRALIDADLDCLHLHGIWMYPSHAGAAWARHTGRPYLISPHGMLDPWIVGRGRWKKALARLGYERRSWASAHAFHALTAREAADIERECARTGGIVIPNAGPAPLAPPSTLRDPHVVYIGRIHSKKNLLPLIAAWNRSDLPEGSRLTIAGWGDDEDVAALKQAVAQSGPGVDFIGPIYGEAKQALLESARFVALPSLSEGLPMAILQAWAAGAPTIMSAECNLPEGFAKGAALECGYTAETIRPVLETALALDRDEWLAMARAGLDLAGSHFSPAGVAACWAQDYAAAIDATPSSRRRT